MLKKCIFLRLSCSQVRLIAPNCVNFLTWTLLIQPPATRRLSGFGSRAYVVGLDLAVLFVEKPLFILH